MICEELKLDDQEKRRCVLDLQFKGFQYIADGVHYLCLFNHLYITASITKPPPQNFSINIKNDPSRTQNCQ